MSPRPTRRAPRPLALDLADLPKHGELSRSILEALALAASVCLERCHGTRAQDPAEILGSGKNWKANIRRAPLDAQAHATYGDPQEATEHGAVGVAVLVVSRVLDKVVFRRLPKRTGADYLVRDARGPAGDDYERLECSGISSGDESTQTRLARKLGQLARFPEQPKGIAMVTNFRSNPVAVHFDRWPS